MTETLGTGCGVLDYNCDGRWDLFFSQGGDSSTNEDTNQPNDSLYLQSPDQQYSEVAEQAGLFDFRYGQAVAIGDFDNDGFDDIYASNAGANTLFRNQGDGTFINVTQATGTGDDRWSSSSAFADLDLDGDLDLYVCNYLQYDPLNPKECLNASGQKRVCHPNNLEPWPDQCFFNQGDGTFLPEAEKRGLVGSGSKGLGVAIADFDGDFLPDLYVANDTTANFLFINKGKGMFAEKAALMGCAMNAKGVYQASMGLGVGDYDSNGYPDIYSTHFEEDSNTLYQNLGPGGFVDVTGVSGLHEPTLKSLAFGAIMEDFNQDGLQELLIANGHVENYEGNPTRNMSPQLFAFNRKNWQDCSNEAGDWFAGKRVARGIAVVDYDNDGDIDPIVVHQNTPVALLQNNSARGHWLNISLIGRTSNRRGIGCHVTVQCGDKKWIRQLCAGTSYASTHQPTLFFGLGDFEGRCELTVRWPSGIETKLQDIAADQAITIDEVTAAFQ